MTRPVPVPLRPEVLVERVAGLVLAVRRDHPVRVGIDGRPAAGKTSLADALVAPLRAAGRPVVRVHADDFLQPQSIRFRDGRDDPEAFYRDHVNVAALVREVLAPAGPGGSRRYVPTLWDPVADRATRAPYAEMPPAAVVVLDGPFTGRPELAAHLDVVVLVDVAEATSRRRAPDRDLERSAWMQHEPRPHVVVRNDDLRHPALAVVRPVT